MLSRYFACAVLLMLLAGISPLFADGFLLPVRPEIPAFSVAYHRVKVNIDRQVATTEIDQAFHSQTAQPVEGVYIFPIREGMSISRFSMYVGGEELTHRILEKAEARSIYTGIVARRRDPALLEWLGERMIQARVFPIQANEDKRIRITYQEVLTGQNGAFKYVYPLKTEKLSARPLQECSVEIAIQSETPLRSIYSPTHNITVRREGERRAVVTYRQTNVLPEQDLVLYYTVSEKDLGVNLLTYRDPEKGDGYFLLLAAPKTEIRDNEVQPKDVIFLLDTSGSMAEDQKIQQAKAALKFCVNSLDSRDRFNIITFNTEVLNWRDALQTATRDNIREATDFVNKFAANGGTDINDALQMAISMLKARDDHHPPIIIFLTDGQPTVGETNVTTILATIHRLNSCNAHIFNFGVGNDYNAHFLDKLANENNGVAENVLPGEDIEVKVSNFYAQVAAPLLTDLKLEWGGTEVHDVYPKTLPDLYKGAQLLLAGRYVPRGNGQTTLRLTGTLAGHQQVFSYPVTFPASETIDEFIPRLWGTRKIGYLEDQVRLNGANKELLEEIIRLSKEYGILSEYTSFLVDVDTNPPPVHLGSVGHVLSGPTGNVLSVTSANAFTDTPTLAYKALPQISSTTAAVAGASAVTQSVNRKQSMNATLAPSGSVNSYMADTGSYVEMKQMQNVAQRTFVQAGQQWVDINYKNTQKLLKVKAFSPAYFQLANAHPRMRRFLSMSDNVIVAMKDVAVQVGADGQEQEFTPAEFKDLKIKMDSEFGVPAA